MYSRFLLILSFCVCAGVVVNAQSDTLALERLYKQLWECNDNDTLQLKLLDEIAEKETDEYKSRPYNKKGLKLCYSLLKSPNREKRKVALNHLASFLNNEGIYAVNDEKYEDAAKNYFYALELTLRQSNNKRDCAQMYDNIGTLFLNIPQLQNTSILYIDSALVIYEELKDYLAALACMQNATVFYQLKNDLGSALQFINKSMAYEGYLKKNDPELLVLMYNNLVNVQYKLNNHNASKIAFEKAIRLAKELDRSEMEINSYMIMAKVYADADKPDSARIFHQKAYNLSVISGLNNYSALILRTIKKYDTKKELDEKNRETILKLNNAESFTLDSTLNSSGTINLKHLYKRRVQFADSLFQLIGNDTENKPFLDNLQKWWYGLLIIAILFFIVIWRKSKQKWRSDL